jgi:hypothetical protein
MPKLLLCMSAPEYDDAYALGNFISRRRAAERAAISNMSQLQHESVIQ